MPRETRDQKALRLLSEHRVRFLQADGRSAVADVRGDTGDYLLTYADGRWQCPCAAYGRCSHIIAAMIVYRAVSGALGGRRDGNDR